MQTEALVQLAAAGDFKAIEEQWMTILDSDAISPQQVAELTPVLKALAQRDQPSEAATLAWAAIETLAERFSSLEVLGVAGPILLELPHSDEVRQQVTGLYRKAYADRPAIDELLRQVDIAGQRPVRRALRTLEVCLAVSVGTYLAARHDNSSAQVTRLDQQSWQFRVRRPDGEKQFGSVELADHYKPVDADDYRVLRDFHPERLAEMLEQDPVRIVVSILQAQGRTIDGDVLKHMLCPSLIEADRWSKWWTSTRAALKRCPNVDIEGRSPFYLTYRRQGRTLEQETRDQFARLHDPGKQLAAVETYLRECKARKQGPDRDLLIALAHDLAARAGRRRAGSGALALATRLVQRRVEQESSQTGAEEAVVDLLVAAPDPVASVKALQVVPLWEGACTCLERALPQRRAQLLAELLPVAPLAACEDLAARLTAAGFATEQFKALEQTILADPVRCHNALFWLWDGPSNEHLGTTPPLTLLTRILWLLGEIRRREDVGKDQARQICNGARSVLSARKFERFKACLDGVELGMAGTLRTQIRRLDNLGRVVHEDLLKLIGRRFPQLDVAVKIQPWADESVIWVTSGGMIRKQQEIDEHVNVKMAENARRIGQAASHGDISDNAEFRAALEERDLLRSRLAQMQEQMNLAKVIDPQDVPTNHVGVGSKVTLRHLDTDTRIEMTLLGPWDADLQQHIYNYKTPLAQTLMGLTVGHDVELTVVEPPGRYELVAIDSALA